MLGMEKRREERKKNGIEILNERFIELNFDMSLKLQYSTLLMNMYSR